MTTKTGRTIALCSALLTAALAHAPDARACECEITRNQCIQDADRDHWICILEMCLLDNWLGSMCSVPCDAMYQIDTMMCENAYDQCVANQNNVPHTCYVECPDGSISSEACLNDEEALCLCDGRSRGEPLDAFNACPKIGGPCP
jgi:hypothetical protein